jgi:hypothetical protein
VGFEPTISAGVRPQTYAVDRAADVVHNNESATAIQMANSSYRKLLVIYVFQEGSSYNVLLCMKNGFKWQGICLIKHSSCVHGGFKFTRI